MNFGLDYDYNTGEWSVMDAVQIIEFSITKEVPWVEDRWIYVGF